MFLILLKYWERPVDGYEGVSEVIIATDVWWGYTYNDYGAAIGFTYVHVQTIYVITNCF